MPVDMAEVLELVTRLVNERDQLRDAVRSRQQEIEDLRDQVSKMLTNDNSGDGDSAVFKHVAYGLRQDGTIGRGEPGNEVV